MFLKQKTDDKTPVKKWCFANSNICRSAVSKKERKTKQKETMNATKLAEDKSGDK